MLPDLKKIIETVLESFSFISNKCKGSVEGKVIQQPQILEFGNVEGTIMKKKKAS